MQKKLIFALALAFMLILSSCGNNNGGEQAYSDSETNTPEPATVIVTEMPGESQPEGEQHQEISQDAISEEFVMPDPKIRAVSVMIDNQGDKVLPQGGISQAQIVYEILTEYNITRYFAFFWGTMPEMIGPVRSSRHYFLDYAMEYDAVYTHYGWSEYAERDIKKLKINNINFDSREAFWELTKNSNNWQDTYTSGERIKKTIDKLKYSQEPEKPFPFTYNNSFVKPGDGDSANDIFIKFSNSGTSTCEYVYNEEMGAYERLRMGKPHIERNTGEQVIVRNIIIAGIPSKLISGDKYGRINLFNIGTGDGFFITGGKAVKIKWKKDKRDAQTVYTDESGNRIILNPGQTWVEIVPDLKLVKIE